MNLLGIIADDTATVGFAILFYRSKKSADAEVFAIHRWSMIEGAWGTDGIIEEKLADEGDRERWKATAQAGNSGFMRLRAVRHNNP